MFSDVRLVIWDLDETFWGGTLTEGGIRYNEEHHDIVIALCQRGIMSSICSKNERLAVQDILSQRGLWDYFIFPSINWSPKADRIREIVEAAQLRPETVLFVDDNPGNRAQAQEVVPGLQVADETAIQVFLTDAGFKGKSDRNLSKLKQYKLLETRHAEMKSSGGNSEDFLRQSGIVATIIYDIENHIDRAVELINRTNQLNFTKRRLPEDKAEAARLLLAEIAPFHARAGLVSVRDRYGDYGICGFFLVIGLLAWGEPRLQHFAFSCRALGMGVEQWVYELLGRPRVDIVGEVLSDLAQEVDWINVAPDASWGVEADARPFRQVLIRGGCELEVLEHFFRAHSESVIAEVLTMHGGYYVPRSHSALLSRAACGLSDADEKLIARLGMDKSFFETRLFDPCEEGALFIYSPSKDASLQLRRHKESGFEAPAWFREVMLPTNPGRTELERLEYERVIGYLAENFNDISFEDEGVYLEIYHSILEKIPGNALLVVVLPNYLRNVDGTAVEYSPQLFLNKLFKKAGDNYKNVEFIDMNLLLRSIHEVDRQIYVHYDRAVYRRLFDEIEVRYRRWRRTRREISAM